jgi:hypothetical protein
MANTWEFDGRRGVFLLGPGFRLRPGFGAARTEDAPVFPHQLDHPSEDRNPDQERLLAIPAACLWSPSGVAPG